MYYTFGSLGPIQFFVDRFCKFFKSLHILSFQRTFIFIYLLQFSLREVMKTVSSSHSYGASNFLHFLIHS